MIELQIDIDALEALLAMLNNMEVRTPVQELARLTLQDAHDNAAEAYWMTKWEGEQ